MVRRLCLRIYNNISGKFATSIFSVVTLKMVATGLLEISLPVYESTQWSSIWDGLTIEDTGYWFKMLSGLQENTRWYPKYSGLTL
jgi:hypothetical protein